MSDDSISSRDLTLGDIVYVVRSHANTVYLIVAVSVKHLGDEGDRAQVVRVMDDRGGLSSWWGRETFVRAS